MRPRTTASLLIAITSAIAACASNATSPTDGGSPADGALPDGGGGSGGTGGGSGGASGAAGAGGGAGMAGAGGGGTGGDASTEDGAPDAASDAPADAPLDANCPPGHLFDPDSGCLPLSIRRPFLVGASLRSSPAVGRSDWSNELAPADALDPRTRDLLVESWKKDGLEEHASVAAFARFTMLLLSVGAPPELVIGSQRASLDEIKHARACFALAARYGGESHGPGPLDLTGALTPMTLAELAALTAEEGCVGETLGAALAREQADGATDPIAKKLLEAIAVDEERHAALAWRFVRWAVIEGGEPVRQAVRGAVERAARSTLAMELRSYDGIDLDAWRAHGRLTCREARAVAVRVLEEVVRPCLGQALSAPIAPLASGSDAHRNARHNRA